MYSMARSSPRVPGARPSSRSLARNRSCAFNASALNSFMPRCTWAGTADGFSVAEIEMNARRGMANHGIRCMNAPCSVTPAASAAAVEYRNRKMGAESSCRIEVDGVEAAAKVLLETDELIVRGAMRLKIPFRQVKEATVADGTLRIRWDDYRASFDLGPQAAKWAEKILNPKSVIDEIGVKSGQTVSIVGEIDPPWERLILNSSRRLNRAAPSWPNVRESGPTFYFSASAHAH